VTPDDRKALFDALLGPVKLGPPVAPGEGRTGKRRPSRRKIDSGLASRTLADMAAQDLERVVPIVEKITDRMALDAWRAGYLAGMQTAASIAKLGKRNSNFESVAEIGARILRKGAGV
jgi:hypothetical protein